MASSLIPSHNTNTFSPFIYSKPTKITTLFGNSALCKVNFIRFCAPRGNGVTHTETRTIEHESQGFSAKFSKPGSNSGPGIKAPTAPWMSERLLVKQNEILDFRQRGFSGGRNVENPDMALNGKVGGGRGRVAMKKIFKSIEKLREVDNSEEIRKDPENSKFRFAPGQLWGESGSRNGANVEETAHEVRGSVESSEFDIPLVEIEKEGKLKKMPWVRDEKLVIGRVKKERKVMAAESSLDGVLLERLRSEAATMKKWVKVKKAGVTHAVVDEVRLLWRNNELALLKFDLPLCRNMDRAGEIVEMKTGGVVVWGNKDFLAVYRAREHPPCSRYIRDTRRSSTGDQRNPSSNMNHQSTTIIKVNSDDSNMDKWESLHTSSLYEREADRLLDGLGPRFVDWWMAKPLPVDADLLPEIVSGLKTPFRLCPPGIKSKLTDDELTYLRKLARPLPTHFVLGRNSKLQGLAAAILKLWEKCQIAKIALKWGAPNTDNEQMANELKDLTGGVLLLRNKFLIILYRGKDFVPSDVSTLVTEREMELTRFQDEEEAARIRASETFSPTNEHFHNVEIIGTLSEFHSIQSEEGNPMQTKSEVELQLETQQQKLENELKDQQQKLFILKKKIEKSAKILEKLNHSLRLPKDTDQELITEEERKCLQEMALKTTGSLVLGRRGIYDGVIEGMHQHWKHKEIVKVITMQRKFSQIIYTAKCLEAESGGILVSIVKLKEGHAIIVYRGKNYRRPRLASENLLNKREALSRSLEIQRLGSMKFFAKQKEQAIYDLKCKLAEFAEKKDYVQE